MTKMKSRVHIRALNAITAPVDLIIDYAHNSNNLNYYGVFHIHRRQAGFHHPGNIYTFEWKICSVLSQRRLLLDKGIER